MCDNISAAAVAGPVMIVANVAIVSDDLRHRTRIHGFVIHTAWHGSLHARNELR